MEFIEKMGVAIYYTLSCKIMKFAILEYKMVAEVLDKNADY